MPRERRKLDLLCPKCNCYGYSYLKKHVKKRRFTRTETTFGVLHEVPVKSVYNNPRGINERRALNDLPPLSDREVAKIERLNEKTVQILNDIAFHWHAIGVIFPLIANKYPHMFSIPDVLQGIRVFEKLMTPYVDHRYHAGDWPTWFHAAYLVETQAVNYASNKTGISVNQIKNKMPLVLEFAKDVINYLPGFFRLISDLQRTLETDPELLDMYNKEFSRAKSQFEPTKKPRGAKVYEYWSIRHPATPTSMAHDCGPFKDEEITDIRNGKVT